MADFIKPKEAPQSPSQEVDNPEQEAEKPEIEEVKAVKLPEIQKAQEQGHVHTQTPEQTGKVVPLSERVETPHTKSERLQDIEKELTKRLEDIFEALNSEQQEKVNQEGEEVAKKIEKLIEEGIEGGKDVSKDVLGLVRDWMHEIPGVNKYFLEQESKRKTDHILALIKTDVAKAA